MSIKILSKEDFNYELINGKIHIKKYTSEELDIIIPNKIDGFPVTHIERAAFDEEDIFLKSIVLPDTLEYIGEWAFSSNEIKSIIIPEGVLQVDENAFTYNEYLEKIDLPNSLKIISEEAFSYCSLKKVIIPDSVIEIGRCAFFNNEIEEAIISKSVTKFDGIFSDNKLTKINIPINFKTISEYAFSSNEFTELTIPDNIERIEDYAFTGNDIKKVIIPNFVKYIGEEAFWDMCYKENLTIFCNKGSYAEVYAKDNEVKVKYLE